MGKKGDESPAAREVTRIGIILAPLSKLNLSALRFLVLELNTLQKSFEYEFLPCDADDAFVRLFTSPSSVDRHEARKQVPDFLRRYRAFLAELNDRYELSEPPPNHFILVSTARFSDQHYLTHTKELSILALGNWKRNLAPPSIIEFIVVLILRLSVAVLSPSLRGPVHLGTKGCLFDFSLLLSEARYKVLNGSICSHCRTALASQGLGPVCDDVLFVLHKDWLGAYDDPGSTAGIMTKLGHDLFITTGFRPSFWESFVTAMQQEGIKELIQILGAILLTALLIWLGLRAG
jgi:hypothetical protein